MAENSTNVSQTDVPAELSATDKRDGRSSPKLRGLDGNPQGAFGPRFWQTFRDSVAHIYDTVSLPDPSEEGRFTLSTRSYATPRGILMRCEGTAVIMTRGPALAARDADQLLICPPDRRLGGHQLRGGRCVRRRGWGRGRSVDYARPFHSVATDYAILIVQSCARERARGAARPRAAWPCLSARERRGASDRHSDAGTLCAGRSSDGERSRSGNRGDRGADDRLRARKAGGR